MANSPFYPYLDLDLPDLLSKSELFDIDNDDDGNFRSMIYKAFPDKLAFNVFERIHIRISSEKKEISEKPVLLQFLTLASELTFSQLEDFVNTINLCCDGNDSWTEGDKNCISDGVWRGRSYFIGSTLVSIELDLEADILTLDIAPYNPFLS